MATNTRDKARKAADEKNRLARDARIAVRLKTVERTKARRNDNSEQLEERRNKLEADRAAARERATGKADNARRQARETEVQNARVDAQVQAGKYAAGIREIMAAKAAEASARIDRKRSERQVKRAAERAEAAALVQPNPTARVGNIASILNRITRRKARATARHLERQPGLARPTQPESKTTT